MDMSLSKLRETVEDRGAWHAAVHGSQRAGHDLVTEQKPHIFIHIGKEETLSDLGQTDHSKGLRSTSDLANQLGN